MLKIIYFFKNQTRILTNHFYLRISFNSTNEFNGSLSNNMLCYTKRFAVLLSILCFFVSGSYPQNIQLHYDYGKDRRLFTSTFEMNKDDNFGNTYMFIDFNYKSKKNSSMSLAYFEISRFFKIPGIKSLKATIQYNDGVSNKVSFGRVVLIGVSFPINLKIISINTQILYRNSHKSKFADFQISLNWFKRKNHFLFKGFIDFWTIDVSPSDTGKKNVLLAEPQIWYYVSNNFAIGGEIEISKNFLQNNLWGINPTIGVKWDF